MARIRGSKAGPKGDTETTKEELQLKTLPPPENNPAKIFILPKDTSSDARIVTFNDPAKGTPSRYLICPEKGPFEFTRIATQKADPRSWFITQNDRNSESTHNVTVEDGSDSTEKEDTVKEAYITRWQDMFVATPIDPIFLLIRIFSTSSTESGDGVFRTLEDYLDDSGDKVAPRGPMLDMISNCISSSEKFRSRIPAVCDIIDTGMDKVYQISVGKLSNEILKKATRIAEKGLPPSMQQHFVTRPLEPPIMAIKTESNVTATVTMSEATHTIADASENSQSQNGQSADDDSTQVDSEMTIESQISTTSTIVASEVKSDSSIIPTHIIRLSQIRTALTFILHSYVPNHLHTSVLQHISTASHIEFGPLDKYLAHLDELRAEAHALRTISDNLSRKREAEVDEEEVEKRAEKKRKQEEEERRKKSESRAIKDLKKVDTKGMMKLSSFFGKKPVAKGKENTKA